MIVLKAYLTLHYAASYMEIVVQHIVLVQQKFSFSAAQELTQGAFTFYRYQAPLLRRAIGPPLQRLALHGSISGAS